MKILSDRLMLSPARLVAAQPGDDTTRFYFDLEGRPVSRDVKGVAQAEIDALTAGLASGFVVAGDTVLRRDRLLLVVKAGVRLKVHLAVGAEVIVLEVDSSHYTQLANAVALDD